MILGGKGLNKWPFLKKLLYIYCKKGRFFRGIFISFCPILLVSCTLLVWNCSGIRRKIERLRAVDFSHHEKSDGFGRERTRDLGFQRPALDHRSRWFYSALRLCQAYCTLAPWDFLPSPLEALCTSQTHSALC
jgi:hypothetical protein